MRIVLLRHADAGGLDPVRYPDDRLRPLTPAGEREHERIATAVGRLGLGVTHILTSPFLRARQTAEITARAVGWAGTPEVVEPLGARFTVGGLLEELGRRPSDAVIVCVGHEPHMSRFASTLLHRDGSVQIAMATSAVIALESRGLPAAGGARLLFMLPPRELLQLIG